MTSLAAIRATCIEFFHAGKELNLDQNPFAIEISHWKHWSKYIVFARSCLGVMQKSLQHFRLPKVTGACSIIKGE